MKRILQVTLWLGLLSQGWELQAQEVANLRAEDQQDSVQLSYVLADSTPGRTYRVRYYAIREADTVLLRQVAGAVGDSVEPGPQVATWYAYREWQRYRGPVSFQVRAVPNFSFSRPEDETPVRRGKSLTFNWYGGNSTLDTLRVELYSFANLVDTLAYLNRTDEFRWKVPNRLPLGGGYRLKVIGLDTSDVSEFSPYFIVERRIPIAAQIGAAGAVLVGGIVYWILRSLPKPPQPNDG